MSPSPSPMGHCDRTFLTNSLSSHDHTIWNWHILIPQIGVYSVEWTVSSLHCRDGTAKSDLGLSFSDTSVHVLASIPGHSHRQAVPTARPFPPPGRSHRHAGRSHRHAGRSHRQAVPTTRPFPLPGRSHHQAIPTVRPFAPPGRSHQQHLIAHILQVIMQILAVGMAWERGYQWEWPGNEATSGNGLGTRLLLYNVTVCMHVRRHTKSVWQGILYALSNSLFMIGFMVWWYLHCCLFL